MLLAPVPLPVPMFGQLWPDWPGAGVGLVLPDESLGVVVALGAAVAAGVSVGVCAKLTEPAASSAPTSSAAAIAALKAQIRALVMSFLLPVVDDFHITLGGGR
jgi:hypothetical protein